MVNVKDIETETLNDLAWDTNLNLREKLIDLRFNPPIEKVNLQTLETEISTLMRNLDEYHTCLYLRSLGVEQSEDIYFEKNQNSQDLARKLENYYNWRLEQLGKLSDLASKSSPLKVRMGALEKSDGKRFSKLFNTKLYDSGYVNHWHLIMTYETTAEQFIDFGDNHKDITFADIIASYKKGFTSGFYSGSEAYHGDQTLAQGITCLPLKAPIRSMWDEHPQPQIAISKTGKTKFSL